MHGAWGALSILIRKQNNAKYRKAEMRYDQQKKKETFLKNHPSNMKTVLEFPKVSPLKLARIKKDIQRKAKIELYKEISIYLLGIVLFFVLFVYWLKS